MSDPSAQPTTPRGPGRTARRQPAAHPDAGAAQPPARQATPTAPAASVAAAPAAAQAPALGVPIGRIPVVAVSPVVEGGRYPAKASVGERFPVRAKVFREGHDAVNASVILTSPDGVETRVDMTALPPAGLDNWEASVVLDEVGPWTFRVEGWSDPWQTWVHHAEAKLPVGMDVELVCLEGQQVLTAAAAIAEAAGRPGDAALLTGTATALTPDTAPEDLLDIALSRSVRRAMATHGPRELLSPTPDYPVFCDRRRALFSAWYEFFPRSQGAVYDEERERWVSGTFDSSHERLEAAAAMGFDIVYLPPIHPIGTAFRKGPNNTLTPGPGDPGSPWAIGSAEGGHDAIHPDLGGWDDFDRFVARATELGLEVALDLALQASPDHPWVTEHPEWFSLRPDGTIAYAENPPKKYQDIYPINFDRDPEGIYAEVLRIVRLWMSHGVRVFRVDNPHTKPVNFWAWLLAEVRRTDPDVIFLAEAFTKPEMMRTLGKVGYQQSYTYFTWRNEKWELAEYLTEVSQETAHIMRPNFFVNTPDINPTFLQSGLASAFTIRAVLAATMSPTWGVYSGFELLEHEPLRQGGEEYLDSEKYQYRPRDFDAPGNLGLLLGRLNAIRRAHPALQQLRDVTLQHVPDAEIFAFSKTATTSSGDDHVVVVCSLNPYVTRESEVYLDLAAMGLPEDAVLELVDELTGATYHWGARNFVSLSPAAPAHVLSVRAVNGQSLVTGGTGAGR
ncbi:alpha-1,4-glucan--maltose-1-phosphate maltosyltransferase [Desertihabitans brevis]|uniref:alpha-1,4-glucan--maltose-1-phosphate maltosyltransferase n=1 Tax=Desertihabitans brevis TaxID=2268447 RepID=UPI003898E2BE